MTNNGHGTSANGHGAHAIGGTPLTAVAVPPPVRPMLRKLVNAYSDAKSELECFQKMLFIAMHLPEGSDWNLDTDTMMLTMVNAGDVGDAAQVDSNATPQG